MFVSLCLCLQALRGVANINTPAGNSSEVPQVSASVVTAAPSNEKDDRFQDEYDPARPNEYEAVRKERERVKQEAQQEADRQEELRLAQVQYVLT